MTTTPREVRAAGGPAAGRPRARARTVAVVGVLGVVLAGLAGCTAAPIAPPDVTAPAALPSARQTPPPPAAPPAAAPVVEEPPAPPPAPADEVHVPSEPAPAAEERLLALVNQARTDAGLAPLTRDPDLDAIARAWSTHLATEGLSLAHNPDYASQIPSGASRWAENVGHMDPSGASAEDVAATIHAAWMDSPGHRANLLDPALTHIGIGVASSPDHGWYLTQDFAAY